MNASHGAVGQNLEMEADPNTAVEQLLLDASSDWMRTGGGCAEKRLVVVLTQRKVTLDGGDDLKAPGTNSQFQY